MIKYIFTLTFLCLASAASAHHSMTEYDFDNIKELQGEVEKLTWRNPHVELSLRVEEADGSQTVWEFEAQDINTMSRRGLTADMLSEGDKIRVAGYPSQRRAHNMSITNLLLPNGTELRFRGNPKPRWNAEKTLGFGNVGLAPNINEADMEASTSLGLFRVWMRAKRGGFSSELPLTDSAKAHKDNWTIADDPNINCTVPGMPSSMRLDPPHPIEILKNDDGNITVHVEFFDVFRTVYMNPAIDPAKQAASAQGFSVGSWDGDALLVNTTKVNWPFFDNMAQIPQSDAVTMQERFELSEDGTQMQYELTVNDSSAFKEPITASWLMNWHPDMKMQEYDCVRNDLPAQ